MWLGRRSSSSSSRRYITRIYNSWWFMNITGTRSWTWSYRTTTLWARQGSRLASASRTSRLSTWRKSTRLCSNPRILFSRQESRFWWNTPWDRNRRRRLTQSKTPRGQPRGSSLNSPYYSRSKAWPIKPTSPNRRSCSWLSWTRRETQSWKRKEISISSGSNR